MSKDTWIAELKKEVEIAKEHIADFDRRATAATREGDRTKQRQEDYRKLVERLEAIIERNEAGEHDTNRT